MIANGVTIAPEGVDSGENGITTAPTQQQSYAWRHIGLHGSTMGNLLMHPQYLQWTSGAGTKGINRDNDDIVTTKRVMADRIKTAQWTVFGRHGYLRVQIKPDEDAKSKKPVEMRFDGFPENDFSKVVEIMNDLYGIKVMKKIVSSSGASFGTTDIVNNHLVFRESIVAEEEGEAEAGEEIISLNLAEVSQCVLPGNNRNEIELQFHESDTVEQGTDQLVQIRFYVPPDPEADPTDKDASTAAEALQQQIMSQANVRSTTGDVIAKFDETQGTFLTPRGRYTIELFDKHLRLRGNKYDYKIKYDDISRLFLLPKPDDFHMAFVIALDKPIRQGQQRYQYLVMQTNKQPSQIEILVDEQTLKEEYEGELQPVMTGSLSNLVAKTFKVVTKKKVFVPGKFANANQHACVKCALKANEGLLYPLEKQFLFIHKPAVLIRFEEIESVEFQRYAGGQGSTRNFDLCVTLHQPDITDSTGTREYIFSGIDRSDYTALYNFLSGKKIRVRNLQSGSGPLSLDEAMAGQPGGMVQPLIAAARAEMDAAIAEMDAADGEESSEDEDYNSDNASSKGEASAGTGSGGGDSDDLDSDDMGEEVSEDSDLEEYRKVAKKNAKKEGNTVLKKEGNTVPKKEGSTVPKKEASATPKKDESKKDGDSSKSAKKRKSEPSPTAPKKKPTKANAATDDSKKPKPKKQKKDPNAPKRPTTAYFYFINEHRDRIKSENPDATFGEIGKLLGAEYKKLSAEDKARYEAKNAADKERYESEMKEYKKPVVQNNKPPKKDESAPESNDESEAESDVVSE